MKKTYVFSIPYIIVCVLGSFAFLMSFIACLKISYICAILFFVFFIFIQIVLLFELTIVVFDKDIYVYNILRKKIIKYRDLKKIVIFTKSMPKAIGKCIQISFIEKDKITKRDIGDIVFYNKVIDKIIEIARKRCVKIEVIDK